MTVETFCTAYDISIYELFFRAFINKERHEPTMGEVSFIKAQLFLYETDDVVPDFVQEFITKKG